MLEALVRKRPNEVSAMYHCKAHRYFSWMAIGLLNMLIRLVNIYLYVPNERL